MTPKVINYIEQKIRNRWSPEQISNTMLKDCDVKVSHECIYKYIRNNPNSDLKSYLRINSKRRYRHHVKEKHRLKIPNRIGIEHRPEAVNQRIEVGHWETDLVKVNNVFLVVAVERKSLLLRIGFVRTKNSKEVHDELYRILSPFKDIVHTITYDNGPEFAKHESLNILLGCKSYFADPYSSYQRGTIENQNGLLRQYYSKKNCSLKVTSDNVQFIEDELSNRPRKTLNWLTPIEYINKHFSDSCTGALGS